jgi:hypothetical protein
MWPPLRPRKAVAVWCFEFAEAIQLDVTFEAFVRRYPAEFRAVLAEEAVA